MKSYIKLTLIGVFLMSLSSCSLLAFLGEMMCGYAPDSDHCYQFWAVQSGNPDDCERIKGTKFKDTGSNPPRDKCYLTIAQNSDDYTVCSKIKWGPMSYSQEECIDGVADDILKKSIASEDVDGCIKISKMPQTSVSAQTEACKKELVSIKALDANDTKIETLIESLKSDSSNIELQKQLKDLKDKKQQVYTLMNEGEKQEYFKKQREEIMKDVDDTDVASAISKEFTTYRAGDGNINTQLEKLEQITQKQQTLKRLDDEANTLVDQVKEQMQGVVNDKQDEIVEKMGESATQRIENNGWERLKYALSNYKWMMDKYEKWSKMYEDAKGKYDKLKGVYDEVMGTYQRIDEVNKMVAEWKIDAGKAKVLKGAVLLDKWLEYTTEYVPVFWSTISKVSKETFGTVIKLAKKRAERSTAIEKCFDDPANCDTDNISAY